MIFFGFLVVAGFAAANTAFYAANGSPLNLGSAVFSALVSVYIGVVLARGDVR